MAQLHHHNPPRLVDADGDADARSYRDVSADLAALDPDAATAPPPTDHEGRWRSVLWQPRRWMQHAACAGVDAELFFPEKGHQPDAAKRMCQRCPVRPQCAEYAIRDETLVGVWGGLTTRERREIRAERRRDERTVA